MEELLTIFSSINSGESESLADSLMSLGFNNWGIDIPLMYGLSLSIQPPSELLKRARSRKEAFIYKRLTNNGGVIYIALTFLEIGTLVDGMLHYNLKNGLTLILADNGALMNQIQLMGQLTSRLQSMVMPGSNINVIPWLQVPKFFNDNYYTGRLR